MSFFRNKHVITAMVVAPLLAVGSYYVTDMVVKEKPQKALEGQSYELVAKSNCRYTSGACDLVNSSFKSTIRISKQGDDHVLTLDSSHELTGVTVGFVSQDNDGQPMQMDTLEGDSRAWSVLFAQEISPQTQLRVAIEANGAHYYAQTGLAFTDYITSFKKNF